MDLPILPKAFYARLTTTVAKDLLGKYLVREVAGKTLIGKITETEAYLGEHDKAAHVSKGRTNRTEVIYGEAGHAYIYVIHGHHALNVVCEWVDSPGSVLLRSVVPVLNIDTPSHGPGRLTRAMQITKELYGADLTSRKSGLYICSGEDVSENEIHTSKRIGVRGDEDLQLRFYLNE